MSGWRSNESAIFGTILPFIGFETIAVDDDGYPVDSSNFDPDGNYGELQVFMIAWLGKALIIRLD